MTRALFIGQTPLQLINLYEASKSYSCSGLFLLFYDCKNNHKRMLDLVKILNISDVVFIEINAKFRLFFPIYLFKTIQNERYVCDVVFFGTYSSWACWVINQLEAKRTILVDDGHKTINIIQSPKKAGLSKKSVFKSLSKEYVKRSEFFTYYAELAKEYGISARQNSLESIGFVIEQHDQNSVLVFKECSYIFIGTNILQAYLSIEDYIAKVVQKVPSDQRMLYVMHRYDDEELVREWSKKYDFDCIKLSYPLEFYYSAIEIDSTVISFGSSALDTLSIIRAQLPIVLYRLPVEGFISDDMKEGFSNIWDYYCSKPNINCVELK